MSFASRIIKKLKVHLYLFLSSVSCAKIKIGGYNAILHGIKHLTKVLVNGVQDLKQPALVNTIPWVFQWRRDQIAYSNVVARGEHIEQGKIQPENSET